MDNGQRFPYGPRGSPFSPSSPNFLQPRVNPYHQQWIPHHSSTPKHTPSSLSSSGYRTPVPSPDFIPLSASPDLSTPPSSGKSPTWGNRRFSNDRNSGSGGRRMGNFRGRGNFNRNFSYQSHSPGNSYKNRFAYLGGPAGKLLTHTYRKKCSYTKQLALRPSKDEGSPRNSNPGHAADIRNYITHHIFEDPWKDLLAAQPSPNAQTGKTESDKQ